MPAAVPAPDLDVLLPSWLLSMRADRKSAQTITTYTDGVRFYLAWCAANDVAPLSRSSLRAWTTALLDRGNAPATAVARQLAVRRYAAWLTEEGELTIDPFLGIKAPKLDTKVVEPLTDDELRALLAACIPPQRTHPRPGAPIPARRGHAALHAGNRRPSR